MYNTEYWVHGAQLVSTLNVLLSSAVIAVAAFDKNKLKIQAVLKHNLSVVVPKLHSVGLISDNDRDQALNFSIDSETRAAVLSTTIESKMINYHSWWILVYVLLSLSSGLDANKTFFESLVISHPDRYLDLDVGHLVHPTVALPLMQESLGSVSTVKGAEKIPSPFYNISLREAALIDSKNKAAVQSPTTATILSEAESMLTKFPEIVFSNYCARQIVTFRGGIIRGEGVTLQVLPCAIEKRKSAEFTIQGCIDGPFELPYGINFASPVYVIAPHYQFQREVTLSADTFINLRSIVDCKALSFLTSPTKPMIGEDGPYWKFQISENAPVHCCITKRSHQVRVQVKHFCLFCFGIRRRGMVL
jgi:hypothetical protein